MDNRVVINPLQLTEETGKLLSAYLKRWRKDGLVISRNQTLYVGFKRVTLAYDLLIREKIPNVWHGDVIGQEPSGRGKFGAVYPVLAVLTLTDDPLHPFNVTKKNKRAYKIQNRDAWHEFKIMTHCPHLRVRGLFGGIPSMISMRYFTGLTLREVINHERHVEPLTISQRYQLTIRLLMTLKKQIHDMGICHKDLSPDNIFYDIKTGCLSIFDLGMSKLINDHSDMRTRGDPIFSAPEEFTSVRTDKPVTRREYDAFVGMKSLATIKSDIYSIARIIGLIWRDVDVVFNGKDGFISSINARIQSNWKAQFNLFHHIEGLSMEDKEKISHQLTSMGALNPDDRPELQSCIDHFQNMYLGHKLETISKDFHNDLIFTQALTRWLFKELKLVNSIEELSRQFEYVVDQLPDNCYAVTHFIELLDMKCFSGLTSRAALLNKIQSIILLYRESLDLMLSTHASYERDGEKIKVKELEHLMQHLLTTRLSLDVMHDHTDHIHRKLGKLNVPRGNTREVKLPKL